MDPHVRSGPGCGKCCLPDADCAVDVDLPGKLINRGARLFVPRRDRPTAIEAVRAWRRPILGGNVLERGKDSGEVIGEAVVVGHADDRHGITLDPSIDRPRCRKPAPGPTLGDGTRDRDRQVGASTGNHRCSLSICGTYIWWLGIRTDISAPRRNVVLSHPSSVNGTNLKLRPLRELLRDQA